MIELVTHALGVTDMASNGGKSADVSIYNIEMADGTTGTLRLKTLSAQQVLKIIE